jgi:hypothetical protein
MAWSDFVVFIDFAFQGGYIADGPVFLILRDVQRLLQRERLTMNDIIQEFVLRFNSIRQMGPEHMSRTMVEKMHADLVMSEEMVYVLRKPIILEFVWRVEAFGRIVNRDKVQMGVGGFVGMKTERILVVRFREKKGAFLRIVGEDEDEDVYGGEEVELFERGREDGKSDWDHEMMDGSED